MTVNASRHRLTVVVVSHNYGSFLDEALCSVVAQSRPPDELVVVDDASSDSTPAVVDRWGERFAPLVSVRNEMRMGPARTFNLGIRRSSGELLVKLDADDRLSETYLERLETALDETKADIAYSGLELFGAEMGRLPARAFDSRELMRENFINGSAMVRRVVWERTGGYREEFDSLGLEDWEFFVNAITLGMRAVPVDGCWLEYRRHGDGSRNTISRLSALRAHLLVHRLHREAVGMQDIGAWAVRSAKRSVAGTSRRT